MSILMPSDTRTALGPNAERCESRSLFMDRFANPGAKDSGNEHPRRDWFKALLGKAAVSCASEARCEWLALFASGGKGHLLYAQLQSRLMVNMADGAMENAGLCLDRFGLPYIPGSAVKGAARRMAIQELMEAREAGSSPEELGGRLSDIALVFGWGEQDWSNKQKEGRLVSDFAYAISAGFWEAVCANARNRLPKTDHFAGIVSFLPAYSVKVSAEDLPLNVPSLGHLELDVLTCHHPDFYRGNRRVATDNEPAVPVIFPSVAAGQVFAFVVMPLRDCPPKRVEQAQTWLVGGLATFGLGAKTAAGYGWFDVSEATSILVAQTLSRHSKDKAERQRKEAEAANQKAKAEAERMEQEKMKAALAALSPDQQEDYKVAQLGEDQFRSALDNFTKKNAEEQKAITRALRLEQGVPGSRRAFWDDLKAKAQKRGGKYAQTEQIIRQLSKQLYPGKEGKMP